MTDELGADAGADVAVIGIACRFPRADGPEEFWRNLVDGVDCITRFPARTLPDGTEYVPAGGLLRDADRFDAEYFGYSPREATITDPQHRLLLECAVEVLERAGHDPGRHRGDIGVYAGGSETAYSAILKSRRGDLPSVTDWDVRLATGLDFLGTRVAYKLGLRGPAVAVQAACATSLVAVHVAVQGLLAGDCDLALAGGTTVHVPPRLGQYAVGGILSPDGTCRTFDADAAGIVGGDGVCLVALRRLPDAVDDGDHIHAVIRGTAVNNDGANRVGYTAPGVEGQAAAIRAAQLVADVRPGDIGYVEAHGTATPLGDPIEVEALSRVFRDGRGPCWIGSVKTNVGHTDATAGAAGLVKAVLAVERGIIPPSLHFRRPNPAIDFGSTPFRVPTRAVEWRPPRGVPRRAGVSAFGMGGTNAHVVLEEAPAPAPSGPAAPWQLLPLSARSPAALDAMAVRLADHLREHAELNLADVAWTLQIGRRELPLRRFALVNGREDAIRVLTEPGHERLITADADAAARAGFASEVPRELAEVGMRWLGGASVRWERLHEGRRLRVPLPTYPFQRRRYLVEPDAPREAAPPVPAETGASGTREVVASLFAEMLGLDDIEPDENFFDLGGDSLTGTRLVVRAQQIFKLDGLGLRALVSAPTVERFTALLEQR
ncbi:beta-ketoacyl synthase N-terminal-like domain-containing protein [Actinomadura gamaensis]|uniref:Beta-ketoacyl synthase N-terminal-like domain-containing protein n=1 Tax=Actinomadura gamaensis TaxID=1763541 RepID=A0ABV9TVW4_9ACTN